MRKIIYVSMILVFSNIWAFGQTDGKDKVKKQLQSLQVREAERAWIPFWKDFQLALGSRDRSAFEGMISKEYTGTGNCRDANFPDERKGYFCNNQVNWWEGLIWIVSRKTKSKKVERVYSEIERRVTTDESKEIGDIAVFRFEDDGKWYLRSKLFWGT